MSGTKWVGFGNRGFWVHRVGLGIFVKYLIDAMEASGQAHTPFLAEGIASWRIAPIYDSGFNLEESWTALQRQNFVGFAEQACARLATIESIPAEEIAGWPSFGEEHLFCGSAGGEVATAPAIELGCAIIALIRGELEDAPEGHWWFYGTPEGRSTIKKRDTPGKVYVLH